ncbi:hypothetical protein GCM10010435_35010 [Winogradskya consettensis]|uniref:Uncharacterized protein n=2 Tax=Winogradskya consettensis TaxID=113560 RepID=A0A919VSQ2_9ACTN|nr:hypothetical protein Aco04nite_40330 [Actinoplanes consettensis]
MNLMRRLATVNPTTAFIIALALLLAGLFLPGIIGGALLFVLGVAMAALTFTTWPVQSTAVRTIRVIMLALLFTAAVTKTIN